MPLGPSSRLAGAAVAASLALRRRVDEPSLRVRDERYGTREAIELFRIFHHAE